MSCVKQGHYNLICKQLKQDSLGEEMKPLRD